MAIDESGDVVFSSLEPLVADHPGHVQQTVYRWEGREVELLFRDSDGTALSAAFSSIADGGRRIVISTPAALVAQDEDDASDAYAMTADDPLLIHPDAQAAVVSANGSSYVFETAEPLTALDLDEAPDIYRLEAGRLSLVSRPPSVPRTSADYSGRTWWMSDDGDRIYFLARSSKTDELPEGGERTNFSVWLWDRGNLRLVTDKAGPELNPELQYEPASIVGGITGDGSQLIFSALAQLTADDDNTHIDVYRYRANGALELVTKAPPAEPPCTAGIRCLSSPEQISSDGSRIFFQSTRALAPDDTDDAIDLYMRASGSYTLISVRTPGWGVPMPFVSNLGLTFGGISADGRRVAFESVHRIGENDLDDETDVYEWVDGSVRLVSVGSLGGGVNHFRAISRDGRSIVFRSNESLVTGDSDRRFDYYASLEGAGPETAQASALSRRRIKLISRERIGPRMGIRALRLRNERLALRLRCPRREANAPCRGRVKILDARRRQVAFGRFRIARGQTDRVRLKLTPYGRRWIGTGGRMRGRVLVRAHDRLGNRARTQRRFRLLRPKG